MPITLTLPPKDQPFDGDIGLASSRLTDAARYATMAFALQLERQHNASDLRRPFWLERCIECLNKAIEDLRLEAERPAADPVDALFDRANLVALNGQVLR